MNVRDIGHYIIIASIGLFALFFANVVIGSMGGAVFLSDIVEMLTLFAACIVFVIGILYRERKAAHLSSTETSENSTNTSK